MSDGNVNRKLLPTNQYQSGFRAGELRMKQRALQALEQTLATHESLTEEERVELLQGFSQFLVKP